MLYSHFRQQKYQKDLRRIYSWKDMSEHIILSNISLGLFQRLY